MSWLKSILSRLGLWREPDLVHPIFGPMHFERPRNRSPGYWECRQETPTKHGPISVLINGDRSGPTAAQVRFFETLCDTIDRMLSDLAPFLEEHYFKEWAPDAGTRKPLTWCGVTIPEGGEATNPWDLSFETNDSAGHMLTIAFEHGKPAYATVDG